jgi:antitoxin VapB
MESEVPRKIRSESVNQLAEKLAKWKHVTKTEAVRLALENELRRLDEAIPLREKLRPLQLRVLSRPATGLKANKAFYDSLSDDT